VIARTNHSDEGYPRPRRVACRPEFAQVDGGDQSVPRPCGTRGENSMTTSNLRGGAVEPTAAPQPRSATPQPRRESWNSRPGRSHAARSSTSQRSSARSCRSSAPCHAACLSALPGCLCASARRSDVASKSRTVDTGPRSARRPRAQWTDPKLKDLGVPCVAAAYNPNKQRFAGSPTDSARSAFGCSLKWGLER
jgi:hypothetical protein